MNFHRSMSNVNKAVSRRKKVIYAFNAVFIALSLASTTCRANEKPKDISSSESILIMQYEKFNEFEHSLKNYVKAGYLTIDVLFGPPFGTNRLLRLKYPAATDSAGRRDDSSLPTKGTKWIIFLRDRVPTAEDRTFETFNDAEGRIPYTRHELDRVLDDIEKRSNKIHFTAPVRQLLYSKIEGYSPAVNGGVLPVLYYAEGIMPIPADKTTEKQTK